jgi:Domain of Unknown Function (DUF326)
MTQHLQAMLDSQPHHPSALDVIRRCIAACLDCSAACTSCADACLAEPKVADLVYCIRLDLDCADLCATTGRIVGRLTKPNKAAMAGALQACIAACEACAAECETHAGMHAHCRICAEACRDCAKACQDLLDVMP